MKCALIGTCQVKAISEILACNNLFKYDISEVIEVHKASTDYIDNFCNERIKNIDLIILQPISTNYRNGSFSTKRIMKIMDSSKVIMIPYIYFDGYFPDICYLYDENKNKIDKDGLIYHDRNIINHIIDQIDLEKIGNNDYLKDNHNMEYHVERITNILTDKTYFNKNQSIRKCNKSIRRLEIRELEPYDYGKPVDVKISDFIKNNYMTDRLFHTMNHPTNIVLYEVCDRILKILNNNNYENYENNGNYENRDIKELLGDIVFPIYPSTTSNLELSFDTTYSYITNKNKLTFDEIISMYVKLYFTNVKIKTLFSIFL